MMSETQAVVQQVLAAWNSHDPVRVAAHYTEDCRVIDVAIAQAPVGRAGVQRMFEAYYQAFPDLEITPDVIITEGNRVAVFWTAHATHQGTILNIPPSGKTVTTRGVNYLALQDGKVCETLTIWDVAGMLRNLGLLPDL
ncbi:MAG: ester cyclase [Caldilinea sp.]